MGKRPRLIPGKYFVFFIVGLAAVLAVLILIFKPGPMSAKRVACVKQMELFGSEPDFRIPQAQIDTMSLKQLDSAIVLFNQLIRLKDSIKISIDSQIYQEQHKTYEELGTELSGKRVEKGYALFRQMLHRQTALLASVDLLAGRIDQPELVDSLHQLANNFENYRSLDSTFEVSKAFKDFEKLSSGLNQRQHDKR